MKSIAVQSVAVLLFLPAWLALAQETTFTKITTGAIVNDDGISTSCAWGDYDNDGDLDLFVANAGFSSAGENNFLYQNNGNDSFTRITEGAIVNDGGYSRGSSWGDYDNDGDLDLFVANSGQQYNFLYQNNGNSNGSGQVSFTKITAGAIVNDHGNFFGSSWGDYDNDSDLDLFVANAFGENNFLYRNNGNGSFTRIREGAIVTDGGNSSGCAWGDYDNDGDLDLFVANDLGQNNFLYQNNGNGTFTKITSGAIVNDGGNSRGGSWGDYDNDGDLDLFVANFDGQNNFLYQNNGNGSFTRITDGAIVNDGGNSYGSSWGDYDNDGDLDLFVANYNQNSFFYQSNGNGSFTKITEGAIVNDGGFSSGSSWGDYDNDGDLDLFVANGLGSNSLYQNNGNSNHWINIRLVGAVSNTAAIGAKVKIKATIGGKSVWQMQEISGQTGGASQNSLNAEFGLGTATMIDSIRVQWPSGLVQDTTNVVVNQFLTITEIPFTRITSGAIVNDGGDSWGSSWGDYDNDNDLDLFVANAGDNNSLYQNNGNGSFTKITQGAIVNDGGYSNGSSWGDYDNDGDLDLFVTNFNDQNNFLYQNNGNSSFTKITAGAIVNDGGSSMSCSWGDYDNDGDLDLFVANYFGENSFLYQNNGNGSFTKITQGAIVNDHGNFFGSSWGDYDNDSDLDLFIANYSGENNFLYQNNGNGSFTKITEGAIVNDGGYSTGSSWGDYDNDNDLDLFVANFDGQNNFLYQNNGNGNFTKITAGAIVNDGGYSTGSSWGDYDDDGDLDLFVANSSRENDFLYQNNGNGSFSKITQGAIVNDVGFSNGSSWGDYDNDGDLDLFVANSYGNNFLYQNNLTGNHWINIRLIGTISNTSAIGARIRVQARIQGAPVWQMQEVSGQTGYASQNSLNAEFGLKKAAIIDSIQIRWPSKERAVNVYTNVAVNQFLTLRENNRPRAAHSIEDINLAQVGRDSVLDLNAAPKLFEDLDHDTLTYSVSSSNSQIATASLSDNVLTVALVSDKFSGRARITISADDGRVDDGRGNTEETSFEINRPPLVFRPIANQTFTARDSSLRFIANLSDVFLDPDGDVLTYSLHNSDSTVAFVDTSGTAVVAAPRASTGEAVITITANDLRGGTRSTIFKIAPNTPPRLAGNGISDQGLILAGRVFTQPLYQVFVDAEGDSLDFAARSSDRGVALAVVENNTLTVVPVAIGGAQITVTANDGKNDEAMTSFHVQVARSKAPVISHNFTNAPQAQNTPIAVSATVIDDEGQLSEAYLWYRVAGRISLEKVNMDTATVNDTLRVSGSIRPEAVTNQGVEYYLEVRDNRLELSRLPANPGVFSVRVRVEGNGITNPRPQPSGSEQNSYHLFSVPFDLDNKNARDILEDDLGTYDVLQWRCYDLIMDTATGAYSYSQFPNTAALTPGKAFWLIIRKSGRYIDTGPGASVLTSERFAIRLQKGWNLVGNPFNFPAYAADTLSNGDPLRFFAYEAADWSDTLSAISRPWQPFEGYAVFANESCNLFVDPDPSRSSTALAKQDATADADARWSIRIRGQCQQAKDGNTIAATHKRASSTWDRLDQPEPPVIGEYVSIYFPHHEWNTLAKTYCIDARPEPTEGVVWDFEIKTNIRDKVNLSFEGIASVPSEFEVWLVDEALQITQNLRESSTYSVAGSEHPKALKLVVGKREFIAQQVAEINLIPATYELSQNFPNPFNPVTTIRYGLPQAGRVTLKIYSVLGEEVATLVNDEQKPAGYHVTIWDGRDRNGVYVASGVYVYRMQAGSAVIMTKKLALVK